MTSDFIDYSEPCCERVRLNNNPNELDFENRKNLAGPGEMSLNIQLHQQQKLILHLQEQLNNSVKIHKTNPEKSLKEVAQQKPIQVSLLTRMDAFLVTDFSAHFISFICQFRFLRNGVT